MKKILTYAYLPLATFYLFMAVVFPTDQATMARRHLSLAQARAISLSVAIPLVIIWFLAFYGSRVLYEYSQGIKKSPDGPPFVKLAFGMQLIAWYLPFRSVTKVALNCLASRHPFLQDACDVIVTHINLIVPLIAFIVISQAAHDLAGLAKVKSSLTHMYGLILIFISLSVAYCYGAFTVKGSIPPSNWLITPQSAIPLPLKVVTIIIPCLFGWFIALFAMYEIRLYQMQVKGIIYRQALHLLSTGLITVILVSIGLQFITAVSANLQKLQLAAILIIAYALIIALGVAFLIIAKGVQRIRKLDEI